MLWRNTVLVIMNILPKLPSMVELLSRAVRLGLLIVCIVLAVTSFHAKALAEREPLQVYHEEPSSDAEALSKKKMVRLSGVDFKGFVALCAAVARDGRIKPLQQLLLSQFDLEPPNCPVCRPLFRRLSFICKDPLESKASKAKATVKKKPKKGEAEEQVEPTPETSPTPAVKVIKELEPHADVIRLTSSFFVILSQNRDVANFIPFVDRFEALLRSPRNKNLSEIKYFEVMAEYAAIPFRERSIRALLEKDEEEE